MKIRFIKKSGCSKVPTYSMVRICDKKGSRISFSYKKMWFGYYEEGLFMTPLEYVDVRITESAKYVDMRITKSANYVMNKMVWNVQRVINSLDYLIHKHLLKDVQTSYYTYMPKYDEKIETWEDKSRSTFIDILTKKRVRN